MLSAKGRPPPACLNRAVIEWKDAMSNPRATRRRLWRVSLLIVAVAGLAAASGLVASASDEGNIVGADSADAVANSYIVVLKPAASSDVAAKAKNLAAPAVKREAEEEWGKRRKGLSR